MKKYVFIAAIAFFLASPRCLRAEEWGSRVAATSVDLFIARPFLLGATIAGGALWFVTLPITGPTRTYKKALDVMVTTPCQLTFQRDLGEFDE